MARCRERRTELRRQSALPGLPAHRRRIRGELSASTNFTGGLDFELNVVDSVRDAANHVQGVVSVCPQTRMVLGGYSQGAIVTALATSGVVPDGVPADLAPVPMPPDIGDHVDAVVLFGKPSGPSVIKYGAPVIDVGLLRRQVRSLLRSRSSHLLRRPRRWAQPGARRVRDEWNDRPSRGLRGQPAGATPRRFSDSEGSSVVSPIRVARYSRATT